MQTQGAVDQLTKHEHFQRLFELSDRQWTMDV